MGRIVDRTLLWAWLTHPFHRQPIPDFALDKHNERGRRLGRSWAHFFDEGTLLHPHRDVEAEQEMRMQAMKAIMNPEGNGLFYIVDSDSV